MHPKSNTLALVARRLSGLVLANARFGGGVAECDTVSLSLSTAVHTAYHDCDMRYDCARGDYAPLRKRIVYHDCQLRYDCNRNEYEQCWQVCTSVCEFSTARLGTSAFDLSIAIVASSLIVTYTTPTRCNGTMFSTLVVMLRVRIPLLIDAFTIDEI